MLRTTNKFLALLFTLILVALVPCVMAQAQAKAINPVPPTLTLDTLNDCTFNADFYPEDVYLNDDGALVVHLTISDYDRFEPSDIEQLTPGDAIVINQESILVDTVTLDDGAVNINGGLYDGGVTLWLCDEGFYIEVLENDARHFYTVGEATLPVSPNFVLKDSWDMEQPEQTILAADFLSYMEDAAASDDRYLGFSAYETEITVAEGEIVSMVHYYAF